jgi:hypothetical protein
VIFCWEGEGLGGCDACTVGEEMETILEAEELCRISLVAVVSCGLLNFYLNDDSNLSKSPFRTITNLK